MGKTLGVRREKARREADMIVDFATKVAPHLMTGFARDAENVKRFAEDMEFMQPKLFGPVVFYHSTPSIWMGASHPNCQLDNAYYWYDEHGSMDCGLFDWAVFQRMPIPGALNGCAGTMGAGLYSAHEDGLLKLFCDEHERYGGKRLDLEELRLRMNMGAVLGAGGLGRFLEKDVYPAIPKEQWHQIESFHSPALTDHWIARIYAMSIDRLLDFWGRRPFRKIVDEFIVGEGAPYFKITESMVSAL